MTINQNKRKKVFEKIFFKMKRVNFSLKINIEKQTNGRYIYFEKIEKSNLHYDLCFEIVNY